MDIASVYLNLASLLGTEIEVEGYYEWGEIRSLEYDRQSLSVVLPRYVWDQGLITINHALDIGPWVKLTVRGCLRQNQRGDPILDPIHSIAYTTGDIEYSAVFIHEGNTITCEMHGDLSCNQSESAIEHKALKSTFFAYWLISKPILIEGALTPPYGLDSKAIRNFSVVWDQVVSDYFDLVRQTIWILFYLCVVGTLVLIINVKNIGSAIRIIRDSKPVYQSVIWIQDPESIHLRRYLGPSVSGSYKRWEGKVKFVFAGQIRCLDGQERKIYGIPNYVRLTFDSLDLIKMSKTITFDRPQDE